MASTPTLFTTMAELLDGWPASREVVARRGMACVGCAMAPFETIAEAAAAYGFDPESLIQEVVDAEQTPVRLRRRNDVAPRARHHAGKRR